MCDSIPWKYQDYTNPYRQKDEWLPGAGRRSNCLLCMVFYWGNGLELGRSRWVLCNIVTILQVPGSPVAKTMLPMQGAQVRSLVRELALTRHN